MGACVFALAVRLSAADEPRFAGLAALAAVGTLAFGLVVRRGALVTLGLALLASGYGISLAGKGVDPAASLFAGGLVLVAEFAFWALEPGAHVRLGRRATARRLLFSVWMALAAVVLGAALLAASSANLRDTGGLGILGVLAVAVVVAVTVSLLHSLRRDGG